MAGRIVAEMERGGEAWDIVSLPTEAEAGDLLGRTPGQWLWDDAYGYASFLRHEKAYRSRTGQHAPRGPARHTGGSRVRQLRLWNCDAHCGDQCSQLDGEGYSRELLASGFRSILD